MEPVRETINQEELLSKFFVDQPKLSRYTYIEWTDQHGNPKVFVNNTARGIKWLYRGPGVARRMLIEAIYSKENCPFRVYQTQKGCEKWEDYYATIENIEWYVDELEKYGTIRYKQFSTP